MTTDLLPAMAVPYRHSVVAPNLHRFVFPSESRMGVEHELLLDLEAAPEDRISCLCEASLAGKPCKHRRAVEEWLAVHGG